MESNVSHVSTISGTLVHDPVWLVQSLLFLDAELRAAEGFVVAFLGHSRTPSVKKPEGSRARRRPRRVLKFPEPRSTSPHTRFRDTCKLGKGTARSHAVDGRMA